MRVLHRAGPGLVILMVHAMPGAAAEPGALTLQAALERARASAPRVIAARARVEEARGRLRGASVRLGGNPVLEAVAGTRTVGDLEYDDREIGLTQGLGAPGRRRSRMAGAEAALSGEVALSEDVERQHLLEVAETFLRALHLTGRLGLLRDSREIAAGITRTAERRLQAGDVAALDLHLAKAAEARALSESLSGEAELAGSLGALRVLLDMSPQEPLAVSGELPRRSSGEVTWLIGQAAGRPDIRALAAQTRQAEAEVRLGRSFRRPELEVGLRYEEEESAEVVLGTLAVSLPVFDRGQGLIAEAGARAARLRTEHDALRRSVESEVRAAFEIHQRRLEAAAAFDGVDSDLTEAGELTTASYEAGQISLMDLLLVRREVLETRMAHLDRQLDAALSGVRLEASAGVLR